MMSLSSSNRNDVLNFNLTFRNLMLSDSGVYEYKVLFLEKEKSPSDLE